MRKIEKIYIDRASEYIELSYSNGDIEEYGSDRIEIVFENDERELSEIRAEQKLIGRDI